MTSKERAYLRGLANNIDAIFQVGKAGVSPILLEQLDKALEARELIKVSVLETAPGGARELAEELAIGSNSVVVQTVGNKITLFRQRKKDSKIVFPN